MEIEDEKYAVTDGSIVFYQYKEETAADKFTAHYGVNVGKYDAKNNETGIPGYYYGVDVDYLEADKDDDEVLEAAVLGYLPAVWYDDYAYIYDYTKTTTTGSKLDIYTYYGVNLNGEVIEFSAYKQFGQDAINGKAVVGNVVWYAKDHNDLYDFGEYDSTLSSLKQMGNTNTVKAREEGKNTDWDTFMNANVVYDLTDTDALKVGESAPVYTFYWDKTAQAAVVYKDHNDDNNDVAIVECAFVVDDTVKYGKFEINGDSYWYPIETETGDAIKYTLKELDNAFNVNAAKYHITDKAGKTELIANDAKFAFAANGEYTVKKHEAIEYGVKNEVTNVALTADSDGNYTTTVPYGTDFTALTAAQMVNVYPMTNCEWGSREIVTENVTADTQAVVVKVTLAGTDTVCKAEFTVTFSWADADYSVTLSEENNTLTATLSADAQRDAATIKFVRLNNGVENIVGTTTEVGADAAITIEQAGSYKVCVYNAANKLICESDYLDVQNDG